jgi:hypothetical protein
VHVALFADKYQFHGATATAASVLRNSCEPERIVIHLFVGKKEKREASRLMSCNLGPANGRWFVSEFNTALLGKTRIRAPNNEERGNLAAPMNYGRFYLHRMLGSVEKVPPPPPPATTFSNRTFLQFVYKHLF